MIVDKVTGIYLCYRFLIKHTSLKQILEILLFYTKTTVIINITY